jgi:hypothetical protein
MKTFASILFIFTCFQLQGQSNIPAWGKENLRKLADRYVLVDHMKPQFLEADFSGDKINDLALSIESKADKKKGIIILFQESDQVHVMGAGTTFGSGGDNFDWANKWETFSKPVTYETTFHENGDVAGSKEIKLERTAISIWEDEGSGGLIYFDGKKFIWIHQGD